MRGNARAEAGAVLERGAAGEEIEVAVTFAFRCACRQTEVPLRFALLDRSTTDETTIWGKCMKVEVSFSLPDEQLEAWSRKQGILSSGVNADWDQKFFRLLLNYFGDTSVRRRRASDSLDWEKFYLTVSGDEGQNQKLKLSARVGFRHETVKIKGLVFTSEKNVLKEIIGVDAVGDSELLDRLIVRLNQDGLIEKQ